MNCKRYLKLSRMDHNNYALLDLFMTSWRLLSQRKTEFEGNMRLTWLVLPMMTDSHSWVWYMFLPKTRLPKELNSQKQIDWTIQRLILSTCFCLLLHSCCSTAWLLRCRICVLVLRCIDCATVFQSIDEEIKEKREGKITTRMKFMIFKQKWEQTTRVSRFFIL